MAEKHTVYVLRNPAGKRCIGQNGQFLIQRIRQHNDPRHTLTRITKRFSGPWELVYFEESSSRSDAFA